jgi:hypothetical protein
VSGRLGTYVDELGAARELVCVRGAGGTRLVIDRGCDGVGGARLVAHIAADEPASNARAVAQMYLTAGRSRRCRSVTQADLRSEFGEGASPLDAAPVGCGHEVNNEGSAAQLVDRHGCLYRLRPAAGSLSIPELRWCRGINGRVVPVSVRVVIGAVEAYEPVLSLTVAAMRRHERDDAVSVALLRAEHERASASPIVLNRRLRETVAEAIERGEVTASEIAIRCGRVRRGPRGIVSGETSWLMRRIGQVAEAGQEEPTPWVHSDVLALIAREGLGVSPREVEA